jgi:hypothetical protein
MGPPVLLPIRRKVCCGFLSPLKIHRLAGFEPPTFGSTCKHTNHYKTEATYECSAQSSGTREPRNALESYATYEHVSILLAERSVGVGLYFPFDGRMCLLRSDSEESLQCKNY